MKKFWEHKKLGEVITLNYGKPLPPNLRKSDGKYPVYGANGIKDRTDKYFYNKPSIIIGRKGSAGEINLTDEKFWPLDVTYYVVFDQEKYSLKFLFYLLSNLQLQKFAKGVKPGINRNDVYSIEAVFPPLPEQQRIVEILDQSFAAIDQAIENTEKNIQKSQEIFNNYINNIFSQTGDWYTQKLGEALKLEYGKPLPPDKRRTDGKYPVYGANGIKDHTDSFYFDQPSIIIGRKGSAGEVTLTSEIFWPLDVTYFIVFDQTKYDLKFLFYLLKNLQLQKLAKGVKPGINRNDVYAMEANFPPLPEQQRIVEKLDNLQDQTLSLVSAYKIKISLLQELKQSILHKAFQGEL
ncbi:MAG: restriction endonuclease subunit S [Anaerolineaceae bacterium]|nr:restriction endonuclease subunit S [Anaerolineaceae bacterium]